MNNSIYSYLFLIENLHEAEDQSENEKGYKISLLFNLSKTIAGSLSIIIVTANAVSNAANNTEIAVLVQ